MNKSVLKTITEDDEISVAKMLIAEKIQKDKKRRKYMRQYYQERKKNGMVIGKNIVKKTKFINTKLIVERGLFVVSFD